MLPPFISPEDFDRVYVERTAAVCAYAAELALTMAPSADDTEKIGVFAIDCQVGFCHPEASLYVPGAVDDMRRATAWIAKNQSRITGLHVSLDTHELYQLFHPAWWRGEDGSQPLPFTSITSSDVRDGRWIPRGPVSEAIAYCEQLEAAGKYVLTVWPFHTLLGAVSHAVVPALWETLMVHSLARRAPIDIISKGRHPKTENYSVLSPEVRQIGGESVGEFDQALYERLRSYDRIYVFGQASSHCVLSTLNDLVEALEADPAGDVSKVHVLVDAMSPVAPPPLDPLPDSLNFPALAEAGLKALAARGVVLTDTTVGL